MRLQNYLTEGYKSIPEEDIDALIQKDCKPFLKQIKNKHLYRGTKLSYNAFKAIPRKDRKPKDTPIEMQNLFDDIMQKLYGWKPRAQGVFVTGGISQAQVYGSVYEIYPIGKFKFIYASDVHDFFTEFRGEANLFKQKRSIQATLEDVIKMPAYRNQISKFIKANYTDHDLYNAAMCENEVMILCKSYYGKRVKESIEM